MLFAFDMDRRAILLIGGDKSDNWNRWYRSNIPIADDRLDQHQAKITTRRAAEQATKRTKKRAPKKRGRR